jgi:hypothetical protein
MAADIVATIITKDQELEPGGCPWNANTIAA